MRLIFFLLFPVFLSAQITRSYGVIEISSFPISSTTGPKFAYNPADSSFYRWRSGSTWVKVIEPSIISAGWGIIKTGLTYLVDSSKVASRYYVSTSPTTIAANYIATSNGSNLVARNLFDNNTYVGILNSKPFQLGQWTTAGRPTGVNGYAGFNTTFNWPEWYSSSGWFSPLQSSLTGGIGTATRLLYVDANGRATDSGNLTYTGTRFQTGGSIRIGYNNAPSDTASIEKVIDVNSKIIRFNNPGSAGGFSAGYVFRGGQNATLATVNTFRIYTNSSTIPGSVYVGNVTEIGANAGNATTNLGVLNKITSTNNYDTGINLHPLGSPENFSNYRFTTGKQFGIFIGGQSGNNNFSSMSTASTFGVFAGFQWQPLAGGFASSWIFSAKDDASTATEILRLQGKDGNICLGCTNAQYKLYTTSTNAYGLPRGTVAQRPTIITSTTPLRFNTDSTTLEYGESVGTWRQIATRAYARSLVTGLGTGTVTSVGLSLPSIFSVSGSPVTTSGTLSATFTGGTSDLFLRGDGRWMKSLYFNSSDSIQFNSTDPYLGSTALMSLKGSSGSFDSRFNVADYGYVNQALAISTIDDTRYNFDRSRGTISTPTALLKDDRIGGIYFNAHNGTSYRKTGYIGAVVDSIHSGANPQSKLIFGTSEVNSPENSSYWRFLIESLRNISVVNHVTGAGMGVGFGSNVSTLETATIDARFHVKGTGTTTGKTMLLEDSGGTDILTITDNKLIQAHGYGTVATTAATLGLTTPTYLAGFVPSGAGQGTVVSYPISSVQDGNGLVNALPAGNVAINAATNDLEVNNLGTVTLETSGGGLIYADDFETDIYNPEYSEIVAGTTAKVTLDRTTELVGITGKVQLKNYGTDDVTSTTTGEYVARVAGITSDGLVQDFRLARDTFIEDVTLFSVGTMMYDCQELTIVSSMTVLAPSNQEIRFPDASDLLRGKKIIVYSKKKDSGAFIPQIKVVGGVSRLYFTTNPAVGGTDPSDQSTLSIDDSTWSDHGTTFEFTCLKIDNTPSYRWVLKQR